ncbi:hypothetical protein DEA98_26925 [Brucella pseudogrignonensis]|jgi:hypothetical protein|nr:hypothetical protein [Brucella pseudogrignonensis]
MISITVLKCKQNVVRQNILVRKRIGITLNDSQQLSDALEAKKFFRFEHTIISIVSEWISPYPLFRNGETRSN